jgi:cobalt/nickel transport system permease protein
VWIVERSAHHNHWYGVTPAAKGIFALAGLSAAYLAQTPTAALAVAMACFVAVWLGAGVRLHLYLRVAAAPLGFLALSVLSLLISVAWSAEAGWALSLNPAALTQAVMVSVRALAALSALLALVLTTPLSHLLALLRRLHCPEELLDLMVLCYRFLFVFADASRDTMAAQSARLGFSSHRRSLHSMGLLVSNLAAQVAFRARGLQMAAEARCSDGSLRFLTPQFVHTGRHIALGTAAGVGLLMLAWRLSV